MTPVSLDDITGPAPFPTHTVTEDFALGMRLRAHGQPYTGIYLPLQLVKGTAPDTIRAAFMQRSRWTKVTAPSFRSAAADTLGTMAFLDCS